MPEADTIEKARFDGHLPKDQKTFFERAALLAGYKNLTEFIFSTVQEKAETIVINHETLLSTERDKEIFFNAIMNPPEPNDELIAANKRYEEKVQRL